MKINKLTSTVIIFIITLILIFLFVKPKYETLNNLQNILAQKQAEYNSKSVYYAKVTQIIKSIESRKESLEKIDSALPTDSYLSSLVYFFQKKGTETGLNIKSMTLLQISAPTIENGIREIAFSIRLSGTYESFKNFLFSLGTSARLFEVKSISFTGNAALPSNQSQVYDFNMEVLTHAY